jgi:hypothetical protein
MHLEGEAMCPLRRPSVPVLDVEQTVAVRVGRAVPQPTGRRFLHLCVEPSIDGLGLWASFHGPMIPPTIPNCYTEFIGRQLLQALECAA